MTPPEHFFTGASLAHIMYSFQSFFKTKRFNYPGLLLLLGIAAMFPDIDSFFGHYVSKDPTIGHRGMTHSFIAVIFFGFFLTAVTMALTYILMHTAGSIQSLFLFGKIKNPNQTDNAALSRKIDAYFTVKSFWILFAVSTLAGISHIIADLFQPPGVWQGIPLFFPLKSGGKFIRHGGFSMTGWYDYKIMWLLIKAFVLSLPFLIAGAVLTRFNINKKISSALYALVIIINCTSCALLVDYIRTSKYKNSRSWEMKQVKYLNQSHPLIKQITIDGKNKFLKIFFKTTH